MKILVGHKYKLRNGDIVNIESIHKNAPKLYKIWGTVIYSENKYNVGGQIEWCDDGKWLGKAESRRDIIEEIKE